MTISSFDPVYVIAILVSLSLAPFVAMMVTSFIKLVVVFSLLRNALGIQQIPPNMVVNGLALILTIYIMNPVVDETFHIIQSNQVDVKQLDSVMAVIEKAKQPLRRFLLKHSHENERSFFCKAAQKLWPPEKAKEVKDDDLMILVPAFTVGQLTSAFQIGFLIYLPFIAIDLIVSNILLAMGMMMVSPMTISLPFKLLLFVLVDGWVHLIHGLILTYA
jgi:type III secretion protein R